MWGGSTYKVSAPKLAFEHSLTEELQEIITLISAPRTYEQVYAWRKRMKDFLVALDCDEYEMAVFEEWNFLPEKAMERICATDDPNCGYRDRIQELSNGKLLIRIFIQGVHCYTFTHLPIVGYFMAFVPTMSLVIECDMTELLPGLLSSMPGVADNERFFLSHDELCATHGATAWQLRRYPSFDKDVPVSTWVEVCGHVDTDSDMTFLFGALIRHLVAWMRTKQNPLPALRFLRKQGLGYGADHTSNVHQFLTSASDDIDYDNIQGGLLWSQFRNYFHESSFARQIKELSVKN